MRKNFHGSCRGSCGGMLGAIGAYSLTSSDLRSSRGPYGTFGPWPTGRPRSGLVRSAPTWLPGSMRCCVRKGPRNPGGTRCRPDRARTCGTGSSGSHCSPCPILGGTPRHTSSESTSIRLSCSPMARWTGCSSWPVLKAISPSSSRPGSAGYLRPTLPPPRSNGRVNAAAPLAMSASSSSTCAGTRFQDPSS